MEAVATYCHMPMLKVHIFIADLESEKVVISLLLDKA
jgi:hypothetical protein